MTLEFFTQNLVHLKINAYTARCTLHLKQLPVSLRKFCLVSDSIPECLGNLPSLPNIDEWIWKVPGELLTPNNVRRLHIREFTNKIPDCVTDVTLSILTNHPVFLNFNFLPKLKCLHLEHVSECSVYLELPYSLEKLTTYKVQVLSCNHNNVQSLTSTRFVQQFNSITTLTLCDIQCDISIWPKQLKYLKISDPWRYRAAQTLSNIPNLEILILDQSSVITTPIDHVRYVTTNCPQHLLYIKRLFSLTLAKSNVLHYYFKNGISGIDIDFKVAEPNGLLILNGSLWMFPTLRYILCHEIFEYPRDLEVLRLGKICTSAIFPATLKMLFYHGTEPIPDDVIIPCKLVHSTNPKDVFSDKWFVFPRWLMN
jgi:hypothetical protein